MRWGIIIGGPLWSLLIWATVSCVGCGDQKAPRISPEAPASKEVQTLREQELAAEKRSAEATAAGDQNAASYNRRLADELAKVRTKWQQIEIDQRAQIAKDQEQIEAKAQKLAETQRLADDVRRARIVAGIGLALCAVAAALGAWFGLGRLALPIAGSLGLGCLALIAFAESLRSAWFLPAILGGLAIAVIAWVRIARGDRALIDTAHVLDAVEDGATGAVEKARAWASQKAAGVLTSVAHARGKQPKTTKPIT